MAVDSVKVTFPKLYHSLILKLSIKTRDTRGINVSICKQIVFQIEVGQYQVSDQLPLEALTRSSYDMSVYYQIDVGFRFEL